MADSEKELLAKLPNEVKRVADIDRVKKEFYMKMKKQRYGYHKKSIFGIAFSEIKRFHYKRQLDKFQYRKIGKLRTGTHGEKSVINELSKLDDNYHVLCGVEIELDNWVTYNGQKNLKSAQMDIVVVCPKGVFMIEVKNWTDDFVKNGNWRFNPYEQTDRAGRVLWIAMQNILTECNVTSVLLSINGNLRYNDAFRFVNVSSLGTINNFITKRSDHLTDDEVNHVVKNLLYYITE
ncbi:MAG: NERD domain-containing protein [Nitrosarchaeum sp.]|nr:NERD domain-containing protein [Nitrosarchaeum sp.]